MSREPEAQPHPLASERIPETDVDPDAAVEAEADGVAAYLRNHPDFLLRYPDVLVGLAPPERWGNEGVVDIQRYMVETLREEIDGLRACTEQVIETSRLNLVSQTRTHAAVLALLGADDMDHLLRIIAEDLPALLDVDVAVLCFESDAGIPFGAGHVRPLPTSEVDRLVGAGRDVVLVRDMMDDGRLFGCGSMMVRSAALARMRPDPGVAEGVLALGSRRRSTFHPGQGTDLVSFVARVTERCLERFLRPAE